jgi:uncharacterized protein YdaU (DUF1376 family)
MSRTDTWMPLFIGDYMADTMHLTGPEHGAYLLLLMHSWRAGPLPDDDRKLAAIARTDAPAWKRMAATMRDFFQPTDAGLVSPRLERERARADQLTEQRRLAGQASAAQRKAQREANERSTSVAPPLQRNGRPSPSQEEEPPSPPSVVRSPRGCRLPDGWLPSDADRDFADGLGLDAGAVAAQFRDYWHAKAGKDAVKLDWPATWRGWCRREAENRGKRGAGPARAPSALSQWADLLTKPTTADLDGHAEEVFP